jgi:hypothetical protein
LVHKFAKLSLDRVCFTSISPLFWSSFVKYIKAPIALRYGTSGPRISSSSSQGRKMVFFHIKWSNNHWSAQMISFLHVKVLQDFFCVCWLMNKISSGKCSICKPRQNFVFPRSFISNSFFKGVITFSPHKLPTCVILPPRTTTSTKKEHQTTIFTYFAPFR